jgi:hypothetical protein
MTCRGCEYYTADTESGECAACAAHRERKRELISKIERMVNLGLRTAIVNRIGQTRLYQIRGGFKAPTVDEVYDINIVASMYGVE